MSQVSPLPEAVPQSIRRNYLFAGVPPERIDALCHGLPSHQYADGEVIFREAETGDCMFLIAEGSVRISKIGRGGNQETLDVVPAGNFFGEMAIIDGKPRSAQATAAGPTTLVRVDRPAFDHILAVAPDLQMNVLRNFVERLRGIDSHFIAEITRAERLATVGSMANSILHDMRNPISVIKGCAEIMDMKFGGDGKAQFTKMIGKAVERLEDMIQELLDFARGQSSLQMVRRPATAVMEDLCSQLVPVMPANVQFFRETKSDSSILVDLGRFVRVLLNLAKNSLEAMAQGGVLTVELREEAHDVAFTVADTGCGIPAELLPKIFEPFVTHGKSKGTGLGLAIAKNVVAAHGGTIAVKSTLGLGTSFEVRIPISLG